MLYLQELRKQQVWLTGVNRWNLRPDGGSWTHCRTQTIYVDADAIRWRDHLAHEVTHAVLCEMRPGTEAEDHEFMREHGLCYSLIRDACDRSHTLKGDL